MKSTRDRILQCLLTHPRSTITDLAAEVGINSISVRHHISSLQVEGLINAEEERHGVGRPRQIYNLTESGSEKFPTNYLRLTTKILDQMKNTLPAPVVEKLFTEIALDMSSNYHDLAENLTLEEKLNLIKTCFHGRVLPLNGKKQVMNTGSMRFHVHISTLVKIIRKCVKWTKL